MTRSTAGRPSNLRNLKISINGDGTLSQKGTIDAAVNVPFKANAVVSATPDGRIKVSTTSVRSVGVPVKPIMKLFHLQMDDLLRVAPNSGVTPQGNDFILDPGQLLAPPSIRGRITAGRIEGNELVQTFGSAPTSRWQQGRWRQITSTGAAASCRSAN